MASSQEALTLLLAFLRSLHWNYWTYHWQTKGETFYGDHLLFEKLYSEMTESIDTLAEKIVARFGGSAVNPVYQIRQAAAVIRNMDEASRSYDCYEAALEAEELFQELLEDVYDTLNGEDDLTLGMDDFLAALASKHETHIYLLQQRLSVV